MSDDLYEFHDVGAVEDFTEGQGRPVVVGDRVVAVFRLKGRFFAIDDRCPHAGASLAGGAIHEGTVVCPRHAWRFNLETGAWADYPRIGVETYPVRISDGRVLVGVPSDGGSPASKGEN